MAKILRPPDVSVPSGRTPGQFIGPGISGGVGRAGVALGRSVQALAGPLIAVDEQIAQVQDAAEEAQFIGLLNTEYEDMRVFMEENPNLYSEFDSRWAKSEEKFQKFTEGVTRKRTQDNLLNFIKKNAPIWKSSVKKNIQDGTALQAKAETLNAIDGTIVGDKRNEARAATGLAIEDAIALGIPEEETKDIVITEKEYKTLMIENLISKANVNGMLWDPLEVRAILNNAEKGVDSYQNIRHLAEESEIVYEAINRKDYKRARKFLKKADITEEHKAALHIKINASENQNEQRLDDKERDLQTENQAKITSDIYANELDASVIDSNIEAALLPDAEGVRGLTVSMAKSLKQLNKREDVVTSDEANIEIDRLIRSVRSGERTYDEAIEEYITKIAKGVNPTEGAQNLDNIRTAADSAKDPILNTPVVLRGHQSLDRSRAVAIRLLGTKPDWQDVLNIENQILDRAVLLDEWAVKNKDDPNFTEKFQIEVKRHIAPLVDEAAVSWFERGWQWSETSPWGTMYWYRKIRPKKEGEEDLTLMTDEQLEAIIKGK